MSEPGATPPARIDFNRHIRPILNQNCTACHGGVKAAGGISFVFREAATRAGESGRPTIVPGKPEASELIARVTSRDPDFRMPKPNHGQPLSEDQIALLTQWIAEGAEWAEHWSFVSPKSQPLLVVRDTGWPRQPLDRFVLARLEADDLAPAAEADRRTLLRRLSLDLTGLNPTPDELAAFIADPASDAYEKQVDRLLASAHFGERWATLWMDLARYADSKGYEKDLERSVWKYRDWLIDVLNRNMPYDRFVVAQLAGDLLPDSTLEQKIATAFLRHTQSNDEDGTDDEEFRVSAVLDRVATTWLVFNGTTFNCVQCHSHPYDPIRHEEFYRYAAFFNNTRDADYRHDYPTYLVPHDNARYAEANRLQVELSELTARLVSEGKELARVSPWEPLSISDAQATPAARFELRSGEALAVGTVATGARYELSAGIDEPRRISALRIEVPPLDPAKARHTPERGFVLSRMEATVVRADGRREKIVVREFFRDSENQPGNPGRARAPAVATALGLAASEATTELSDVVSAPPPPVTRPDFFASHPTLSRTRWLIAVPAVPLQISAGDRIEVLLAHGRSITGAPAPVRRVRLATTADLRWTDAVADAVREATHHRIAVIEQTLAGIPGTHVPVTLELPPEDRLETRLFVRGNWLDKGGPPLEPDVPALFPPLPAKAPRDRLTLARWFVTPGQPLTSRVAVNRYWEQLFGIGLVETLEDFGSVGEPPSHPALLDWLALRFENELGWDVKALLRELVTSATYRQSAKVTPALLARDPRNRLLARGPRNRLTAEMVRDQALNASGLLSRKLLGPPVMPPQPDGVWNVARSPMKWIASAGEDRHRRAVYTFWRRSTPYPSFLTFDAPTRDMCSLRRTPTNTPLQALVTLNDPVFHEAAVALAYLMQSEGGPTLAARLVRGFELVTSHRPDESQQAALLDLYNDVLAIPSDDPAAGVEMEDTGAAETAALTAVAATLLNLDAALTK